MKEVELRRHTANDGDALTPEGIVDAVAIGRHLAGRYEVVASSGAQRATQTAACFVAGLGEEVPGGVVVTGVVVDPMAKGAGVVVRQRDGGYDVLTCRPLLGGVPRVGARRSNLRDARS